MKRCPSCQSAFPATYTHCPRDGSSLTDSGEWSEGTVVRGKYRILGKIGQGGMAAVYKALHVHFKEPRALKVIHSDLASDASFVRRFQQEAIITRKLQHPNAVRVDDIEEAEDGRPFIVMEYVEGGNLKDVIEREAPIPVARVCVIVKQIAAALDAAHRLGLVHRDIKPANVALVGGAGLGSSRDRVKVLDFGIAKLKESHLEDSKVGHQTLTGTGMVIGTPAYMSPEQAKGLRGEQLDGRSDLYSLGVVAYQMLTGDLPFKCGSTPELLMAHISTPPKPIHQVRPDLKIPPAVAAVVMRCLEKNRDLRPANGQVLIDEIESASDRGRVLPEEPFPPVAERRVAPSRALEAQGLPTADPHSSALRSRSWLWAVAAVLIAGALAGAWYLLGGKPTTERAGSPAATTTPVNPVASPTLPANSADTTPSGSAEKAKDSPTPVSPPRLPSSTNVGPSESARKTKNSDVETLIALNNQENKFSYALGMNLGQSLHKQSVPVDSAILQRGLRDALAGGKTLLSEDEAKAAIIAVQNDISTKQLEKLPQIEENFSYALGMNLGLSLHKQAVPVDPAILQRGLRDALAGGKTLLSDDEAKAAIMAVQTDLRQKQQEKTQQAADGNKKEGAAFLEANKSKAGVVTLPSGLQYKILKEGTGAKPTTTDSVVCNYRGTFLNGTEFDSSYKRNEPATFPVTGVIKGWTEALQLMTVGSKWQLFIPSDLAYGDAGRPGIDPGATLIFEVELMSIQDKSQDKK